MDAVADVVCTVYGVQFGESKTISTNKNDKWSSYEIQLRIWCCFVIFLSLLVRFKFKLHPIALEIVSSLTFLGAELVREPSFKKKSSKRWNPTAQTHISYGCVCVWVGILSNKFLFFYSLCLWINLFGAFNARVEIRAEQSSAEPRRGKGEMAAAAVVEKSTQ